MRLLDAIVWVLLITDVLVIGESQIDESRGTPEVQSPRKWQRLDKHPHRWRQQPAPRVGNKVVPPRKWRAHNYSSSSMVDAGDLGGDVTPRVLEQHPGLDFGGIRQPQAQDSSSQMHWYAFCVVILVFFVFFIHTVRQQRVLGKAVQAYIEGMDRDAVLGVEIRMDSCWINPLTWTINIRGLVIGNPAGYKSSYLVRMERVAVSLDLMALARSQGFDVQILSLFFRSIEVNLENGFTTSNAKDVTRFLYYGHGKVLLPPSGRTYTLRQVLMDGIKVKLIGHWTGAEVIVPVADFRYENFAEEVGDSTADEMARHLLQGLMTKVLANESIKKRSPEDTSLGIEAEDDVLTSCKTEGDLLKPKKLIKNKLWRYGTFV